MKKQVFFFLMGTTLCLFSCRPSSRTSEATDVHEETTVSDSVQTCKGRLIMGHEAYSFTPEGDTLSYWVVRRRYLVLLGSRPFGRTEETLRGSFTCRFPTLYSCFSRTEGEDDGAFLRRLCCRLRRSGRSAADHSRGRLISLPAFRASSARIRLSD